MKQKCTYKTTIWALLLFLTIGVFAQEYDLVILNGRVMDLETMHDAVHNVGEKDGMLKIITKDKIEDKESIHATGSVVAAGFIDSYGHSMDLFAAKMGLPDGLIAGIPYVIIGGNIVVKDSKIQDVFVAQTIRYPREEVGGFVSATQKNWLKEHSIDFCPPQHKSNAEH